MPPPVSSLETPLSCSPIFTTTLSIPSHSLLPPNPIQVPLYRWEGLVENVHQPVTLKLVFLASGIEPSSSAFCSDHGFHFPLDDISYGICSAQLFILDPCPPITMTRHLGQCVLDTNIYLVFILVLTFYFSLPFG